MRHSAAHTECRDKSARRGASRRGACVARHDGRSGSSRRPGDAVRSGNDLPGDVEDAVPGQSRADPVVVATNQEVLAPPEATVNGSGVILVAAVAEVTEVLDRVVRPCGFVPPRDQRLVVRLDGGERSGVLHPGGKDGSMAEMGIGNE